MNLVHLKYAVEIAKTNSITKAAENLYTTQPHISRSIRELEATLGVELFRRTPKGLYLTPQGEEFIGYAQNIISQVETVESLYRGGRQAAQQFSISVPRANYISTAFTAFVKRLDPSLRTEIFYKETNSERAIINICESDYKLGILRYQESYDRYFKNMLEEKGLHAELIYEFSYRLIMSRKHPLATKAEITIDDLTPYTEIAHADPFVPSLPLSTVRKNEVVDNVYKHIYVFERGSQMDILSESDEAFIWVSPMSEEALERFGLVERVCAENKKRYRDILIYKKDYTLSNLDLMFIDELNHVKAQLT
ncbi:MAG: LysR family transcriptional regulator [Ruminococcaceae bacterium]|nr:LysR family transcriptional regulator [Oscillospiraceae bacterium]